MAFGEPVRPRGASYWRFMPLVALLVILGLVYAFGGLHYLSLAYLADRHEALKGYVARFPLLAPLLFAVAYAVAVAVSFPAASLLTVFAGLLFGWLLGGVVVAFAATLGATCLFLAARSAFGTCLRRRIGPRAGRLARGFEKDAFSYLLVLRLAPVFPFFLVNVAPAFFKVRLSTYVAATFIGILPGTFAYAYLGTGLESALAVAAAEGRDASLADLATPQLTLALLLLAVVAAAPIIIKKLRKRRG